MAKRLTRFVVEIDGELKRLFSVREAKRGLLTINTDAHETISTNQGQTSEIRALKHSVHTSERSETGANMVHMTQDYANGTTKEMHLLTHAVRDGTFAPIYQRLVADPRNRPTLVPHKNDVIVSIGRFDPSKATLIYGVWLSSVAGTHSFPADRAYSTVGHEFQHFGLSVAFGFTVEPSTTVGFFLHYGTTNPETITEVEQQLGYRTGIVDGEDPTELPPYIIHEMNDVFGLFHSLPFGVEMMRQKTLGTLRPPVFLPTPP